MVNKRYECLAITDTGVRHSTCMYH